MRLKMVGEPEEDLNLPGASEGSVSIAAGQVSVGAGPVSVRERDEALVRRTLAGDKSAFRELFELYRPRAYFLALEILKSHSDAEDVVQESFVKAYLALPKYRGQAAFFTWFFRIVYNMAIDFKRKIKRRGGEPLELQEERLNSSDFSSSYERGGSESAGERGPSLHLVTGGGGQSGSPEAAVERRQNLEALQRALGSLSEEHRAVITLREIDDLSYDEIAEITGVGKGTVMSRLHYARKALQSVLRGVL